MDYYYSKLKNEKKKAYDAILAGIREGRDEIIAEGINTSGEISECFHAIQYDHPEILHVNISRYQYIARDNSVKLYPEYIYDKKTADGIRKKVDFEVNGIISEMRRRQITGIYRMCWFIHWYLVKNCIYDHEAIDHPDEKPFAWTTEGVFLKKKAVCQGIALAFVLLCKRCGVDAIVARGVSLEPGKTDYGPHAWNIVFSGKEAAQLDVTWDMCLTKKEGPARHDYFFLPDIDMMRDHQYTEYPYCRRLNATWFEMTGTFFSDMDALEKYISELVKKNNARKAGDVIQFHCRLYNRKESYEKVWDVVSNAVMRASGCGCKAVHSENKTQSVICYRIELI